jgi:cell division septal protein FtsQ
MRDGRKTGKKRKGLRLRVEPFVVMGIVGSIFVGAFYSPLTSLTKVRVIGADKEMEAEIATILRRLRSIPALQVSPAAVETSIQRIDSVDRAVFERNLFGRATLRVTPRVPVARLADADQIAVDRFGNLYRAPNLNPNLPVLRLPSGTLQPSAAFVVANPMGHFADVCRMIQSLEFASECTLEVDSRGGLCLNVNSGRILLGNHENMDKKLDRLREVMNSSPQLFRRGTVINLVAPDRAVLIQSTQEKSR